MVIYAVSTNTSIGKLFIAGIMPGIMLATMLMSHLVPRAKKRTIRACRSANWRERVRACRESCGG